MAKKRYGSETLNEYGIFPMCDEFDEREETFVCADCGYEHYGALPNMATWHVGECSKCGEKDVVVTEERDFRRIAMRN